MDILPYRDWLTWLDSDQTSWNEAHPLELEKFYEVFLDLMSEQIQSHPQMLATIVRYSSIQRHRGHVKQHLDAFTEDPRTSASQYRSHLVGLAHIQSGVLPSWYVTTYNLLFPAAHRFLDTGRSSLPPLPSIRRRWLWDMSLTLDTYHQGIVNEWHLERGQLETELETVRSQAYTDMLTGLPNRHALEQWMENMVPVIGQRSAFILLDLDGFKRINDRYGHPHGDQVLQTIGRRLRQAVRHSDMVARLGGDEFVIWFSAIRSTNEITERLRNIVSGLELKELGVGVSAGIACYPEHGINFSTLYRRADEALYQAKHQGKGGMVSLADSGYEPF